MNNIPFRPRFRMGILLCAVGVIILLYGTQERLNERSYLWGGSGALVVGAVCVLTEVKKRNRIEKLINDGYFAWGEIICIDNPWKVNGKTFCCFRVRCIDASGATREFLSDAVSVFVVHGKVGYKVKVYMEENCVENYYIDTNSICSTVK